MINNYLNVFFILFLNQYIHSINTLCPPNSIIRPCSCIIAKPSYTYITTNNNISSQEESIICENISNSLFNLQNVFSKLSLFNLNENTTYFNSFRLYNTKIKYIPANVFVNIKFKTLIFENNTQLTIIDKNAFLNTKDYIEIFETLNTNLSDTETIFSIIKQFQYLRLLSMHNDQLKFIPNYAFNHKYLTHIWFGLEYSNRTQPIETIGNFAFYNLPNINFIRIFSPKLAKINRYSFALRNRSLIQSDLSNMLELYIGGEMLNSNSFEITSLNHFKNRFVFIRFYHTNITYLDENIFQPFLESNPSSIIDINLTNRFYKCHCRSAWIQYDYMKNLDQMDNRVYGYSCWDYDFTNCTQNK